MENGKNEGKKSLMFSAEKLEKTASIIEELTRMSESMVDKLKKTDGDLKREKPKENKPPSPTKTDIIDLFDNANLRIEVAINQIQNNIERVINMIE